MLTVQLNDNRTQYVPGEIVAGTAAWELPQPPKDATLRLFWYTQGRGTQDVAIVEELALPPAEAASAHAFQFTLPAAPYSFGGALISLQWAVELIVNGTDAQRADIVVSPWTEVVTLKSIEMK
jgi:hypothetical protein